MAWYYFLFFFRRAQRCDARNSFVFSWKCVCGSRHKSDLLLKKGWQLWILRIPFIETYTGIWLEKPTSFYISILKIYIYSVPLNLAFLNMFELIAYRMINWWAKFRFFYIKIIIFFLGIYPCRVTIQLNKSVGCTTKWRWIAQQLKSIVHCGYPVKR